jgi:hypothetical protein
MNSEVTHQPPIELSRKAQMKDGLLPIVAVAGAVSVALLWSMSAQDPYWRLFESADAPAFEQNLEPSANWADAPLEFGNVDTGSMSQSNGLPSTPSRSYELPRALSHSPVDIGDTTIPAPMIALAPPAEPGSLADPGINMSVAYGPPRAAIPERVDLGSGIAALEAGSPELVIGFAPTPLPVPMVLRDRGNSAAALAVSGDALDPFVAPAPPAQPHIAATMSTEEALNLKRSQRINVQRRLALAGFNPHGADGVFGSMTRGAIADFQTAWGFPATGYLETALMSELTQRTEEAYQAWRHQVAAANSAAPEIAPAARERQFAGAEGEGRCARDNNGRIIERQSLACDLAGFGEKFISLGRNTLNDEDDETTEAISGASPELSSDLDR